MVDELIPLVDAKLQENTTTEIPFNPQLTAEQTMDLIQYLRKSLEYKSEWKRCRELLRKVVDNAHLVGEVTLLSHLYFFSLIFLFKEKGIAYLSLIMSSMTAKEYGYLIMALSDSVIEKYFVLPTITY